MINQNINPNKLYINGSRLKFKSSPENEGLDRAMISAINFWWTLLMCFTFFAIQRKICCRLLNIWSVRWSKCDKLIWSSTFRKANDWKKVWGWRFFQPTNDAGISDDHSFGGKYFAVSSNVLYEHHVVAQQLPQHEWSIEYDKHSSIKCNELSHSGVHSCSFTWQKRDFISLSGARGRSEWEESLNLSTFLSHQHVDWWHFWLLVWALLGTWRVGEILDLVKLHRHD